MTTTFKAKVVDVATLGLPEGKARVMFHIVEGSVTDGPVFGDLAGGEMVIVVNSVEAAAKFTIGSQHSFTGYDSTPVAPVISIAGEPAAADPAPVVAPEPVPSEPAPAPEQPVAGDGTVNGGY